MKLLNTAWVLALGFDAGALMVVLLNQYVAIMSAFIIWAVMLMIAAILILCTVQVRMMEPKKKKLPVRRASRGKLKVVGK